jgi:hypothetical protein
LQRSPMRDLDLSGPAALKNSRVSILADDRAIPQLGLS